MQKSKLNIFRIVLAVLLFVFTISSIFYTAHEMHHECSGEDCPICYVMQLSTDRLKLLTFALASILVVVGLKKLRAVSIYINREFLLKADTLISQKIRLND